MLKLELLFITENTGKYVSIILKNLLNKTKWQCVNNLMKN